MAVPEVNKNFLSELEAMGFSEARATRALHGSGNSSIEAAIDWIIDHENDPEIDEMPLVPLDINIEDQEPSEISDQVKIKAQQLREQARKKKEKEEKKLERNREKERIRSGKDLQEARRTAEENERKRYIAQKKAEKEESRRARERIRQKLEQDKAERRRILGIPMEEKTTTFSLPKRENNTVPAESATLSHKSSTEQHLLRECLIQLKRQNLGNDAQMKMAFHTLLIYVRNVMNYPDEGKFRKIRLSNPAFQVLLGRPVYASQVIVKWVESNLEEKLAQSFLSLRVHNRVGSFSESIKFLELCGFERVGGGDFLYLPRDKVDMALLKEACTVLHSAITNPFFGLLSSMLEQV